MKLLTRSPVNIVKPLYREQLVAELCQEITAAAQAGENNKFLLFGLGGVGKTTVARALYRKLKSQCEQIGWVECRESGDLKASLLAAIDTGNEKKTDEERFSEIENRLQGCTGQTILFLDNVDQPDKLLTELTRYDVTLVVTSRLWEADGYITKRIPPLSEDECVELFRSYCSRTVTEQDEPVVRELVRLVSCHTLSVELLAKSVPAKASLAEYLEQLQARNFGFSDLKFSTGHDNEKDTVVKHLKKLFDMTGLDGEQSRVMQNLALMADSHTLPAEVQKWIGCDENTLAELVNTGWLSQTDDANKRGGYEVHPIVREIVLLDPVPVEAVAQFLDFVTYETYFQDGEDYRVVQFKLGIAEAVLERVGNRLEKNRDSGALYTRLGNVYVDQGKFARGEYYYKKVLKIDLEVLGPNHRDTAIDYNNLGAAYSYHGKYAQAEECHKKALDIQLKVLGEDHP
ncbi:MAG: tetratricopeptide repeat protein, partial [Clostridiales bacterium]|nr:tetratricopeptide repeat protein [Clostridiales bacterium]